MNQHRPSGDSEKLSFLNEYHQEQKVGLLLIPDDIIY